MTASTSTTEIRSGLRRRLGHVPGARPGPLLIAIGGIHGNEPHGVRALRAVLAALARRRPPLRGDFVALAGNLEALGRGCRFVDRDLNRQWLPERLEHLHGGGVDPAVVEDRQQWELLTAIEDALQHRRGPAVVVDLHTTSGRGAPFAIIEDSLRNRRLAFRLPMPVVLGLEEKVEGTVIDCMNNRGHMGISVEGGRHGDPAAQRNLEAVIWILLVAAGLLRARDVDDLAGHRRALARAARGVPRVVEVRHRHGVSPGDAFTMRPGFANFSPVSARQELACDRHGPVRAPESGLLLLPLYQRQGSDGFFIVHRIRRAWLAVGAVLRRLRLARWLHLLPGVRRPPERPHLLIIDLEVARYRVIDLFHLLGYRRERQIGSQLVVTMRRSPDHLPPGAG